MDRMEKIKQEILQLREVFLKASAEMDESAAYVMLYKPILMIGEGYGLLNISNALRDEKDLFGWFSRAYVRADKILFREYLETQNE